ncbi:putative aminoglycoside3-N-acetyltransferase family protein [Octadecabacter arcticus 238]|jgi:aminoglycoside 3-N-acetyltransferase|uniref:Aminoglycoside N(3)-acetyltransferase n=1 Tax=Octadecabacter arcticus 238 TaxID=391616 RepID=M9RRT5_9RHOB|nr:AAC(3) family N-acetyltransferase [Octadecabacter arcticus]AGI72505.1 putative aminoglycoside3-N-acetyltransferase family protein [Octadecabacter arcticus 238]
MYYSQQDIVGALKNAGINEGDTLFSHSNLGYFGMLQGAKSNLDILNAFKNALFEVIGEEGTFVVPTFTYSFGSDKEEKVFDVKNSASKMGSFAEFIRLRDDAARSEDPMFSVAAIGPNAERLTKDAASECFGRDSFWGRFHDMGGKICNFNLDSGSTFVHYVEKRLQVPYRKDFKFSGQIISSNGTKRDKEVVFFARDFEDKNSAAYFERLDVIAKNTGLAKQAKLGRGSIVVISAADTVKLIEENIEIEPNFLNNDYKNSNI